MKTTKTTTQSTRVSVDAQTVSAALAKANLDPQLEAVLRMRFGISAGGDQAIAFRGQAVEESRVKLGMMEHELLSDLQAALTPPDVEANKERLLAKLQDMADEL